jgi:hypothetical protein
MYTFQNKTFVVVSSLLFWSFLIITPYRFYINFVYELILVVHIDKRTIYINIFTHTRTTYVHICPINAAFSIYYLKSPHLNASTYSTRCTCIYCSSVLDQDLDWEFGSEWGILIRILEARKTHVLKCCLWWAGGFYCSLKAIMET